MSTPTLQFSVAGSTGNLYEITASKVGDRFIMTCDCEAGIKGTHCKHRTALLDGECSNLLSDNRADIEKLQQLFSGSNAEKYYCELIQIENEIETLKSKLKSIKRAFSRAISP